MNILVTGANGFIASNVIENLQTKFNVFKGTRKSINLYSSDDIERYIDEHKIDSIIHCAIEGGNRIEKDDVSSFYNNILIYENLMKFSHRYKIFINIGSGAEFDRRYDIQDKTETEIFCNVPVDYYGLSKNIISKSMYNYKNCVNLRIFGCFYHNELNTRYIKNNIHRYINYQPIIIHQDRYMDFVYFEDLYTVMEYYINNIPTKSVDVNIVYNKKYKLSNIANIINNLDNHKVDINVENKNLGLSYTGCSKSLSNLNLNLKGIEIGIREIYDRYKFNVLH